MFATIVTPAVIVGILLALWVVGRKDIKIVLILHRWIHYDAPRSHVGKLVTLKFDNDDNHGYDVLCFDIKNIGGKELKRDDLKINVFDSRRQVIGEVCPGCEGESGLRIIKPVNGDAGLACLSIVGDELSLRRTYCVDIICRDLEGVTFKPVVKSGKYWCVNIFVVSVVGLVLTAVLCISTFWMATAVRKPQFDTPLFAVWLLAYLMAGYLVWFGWVHCRRKGRSWKKKLESVVGV